MLLTYKKDLDSIKEFESVEISDFAIMTGINGAGKTHLLKAIQAGHVNVSNIPTRDIAYFSFLNFRINKEDPISIKQIRQEKNELWQSFTKITPHLIKYKQTFTSQQIEDIKKILEEKKKPMLSLKKDEVGSESLFQLLNAYEEKMDSLKQNYDQRIIELAYEYSGFFDEISEEDFLDMIRVNPAVENFLTQQISKIFLNFNDRILHKLLELINKKGEKPVNELMYEATSIILKKYGGKYPWHFINDLLTSFSDFKYKVTEPPKPILEDIIKESKNTKYVALLNNEKLGIRITFDKLSSGEQILLALAIAIFDSADKHHFPKLVLLDEIDSSLHPTMVKNLLRSLQSTFVNNGVKMMLVTHSASTIAYAPENSIYLVDSASTNLIKRTDKHDALDKLTQGYMTLKDGNVIFDAINNYDLTIFSEGNNVKYIKTAIDLHCKEIANKINVWEGIENKTSVGQLETLYNLLKGINLQKKILIVFDPDAKITIETNQEKLIFVTKLKNIKNKYTQKGVESNLPDEAFSGFRIEEKNELLGSTSHKFPDQYKTPLANKLCSEANPEIFNHFKPLTDQIKEILAPV